MENRGQKRSADDQVDTLEGVQAIVLDIEGTTTPITFVKDKLFPYVRENVKSYLKGHFDAEECQEDLQNLREQAEQDKAASVEGVVDIPASEDDNKDAVLDAAVASVLWQMDQDRKSTCLKQLQGHMWREAYKTGLVQGEIYGDVKPALMQWAAEGKRLYIYSSGSVEAQKLLFGYSVLGDLVQMFSGFFDTTTGAKTEKESYTKIAETINLKAEEIAFFTDLSTEATAATEAGMKTIVVEREGNAPLSDEDRQNFYTVSSFLELCAGDAKKVACDLKDDEDGDDDLDDLDDVDDDIDDLDGEVDKEDEVDDKDDDVDDVDDDDEAA